MDILAARKKAAAQAKVRQQPGPIVPEDAQPAQDGEPYRPAEPAPAPQVPTAQAPENSASLSEGPVALTATSAADEPETEEARELELLSFHLRGEEYALRVGDVQEVLKIFQLTPVPNTPEYILGVISLRGTVTPVFDLGKRLGIPAGVRDDKARVIVATLGDETVGLMVDRVTGVFRISPEEIKPTPENIEHGAEFLRGIVRKDDKLYILLDLEKAVGV